MNQEPVRHVLRQLGYDPVDKPWGLLVRLPLGCDLRIRFEGDGPPRIRPFFGSTPRSLHSWLMPVLYLLLLIVFLQDPGFDVRQMAGLVILVLLGCTLDVCRYVVTEGAMTRIATYLAASGRVPRPPDVRPAGDVRPDGAD
jgi:hypothetical protein